MTGLLPRKIGWLQSLHDFIRPRCPTDPRHRIKGGTVTNVNGSSFCWHPDCIRANFDEFKSGARATPSNWQPIETAPRDGTFVLTASLGWPVWLASWKSIRAGKREFVGWTRLERDGGDWQPTHWMPLPEPPK